MNPNTVYAEHYPLEVRAAVYCRLSKDDDQDGTSASIQNQKELLHRYCEEQGWRVAATFEDDGYTGLNMERPGLKRLDERPLPFGPELFADRPAIGGIFPAQPCTVYRPQ